jgi:hypothetical protein
MTQYDTTREPTVSGWAVGGITFAGTMLILIGMFQAIDGIAAIANDEFFVVGQNYTFDLDTTAWGWIPAPPRSSAPPASPASSTTRTSTATAS